MTTLLRVLAICLATALVAPVAALPESYPISPSVTPLVRTGLDVFLENPPDVVRGKRVGLITNPSGVDARLRSAADLLAADRDIHLVALFGPEHGVRGDQGAGAAVKNSVDPKTGLPVYSLYGATRKPTAAMLRGIDVLVFDIQDVGARFYTYMSTLAVSMQAAAAQGIPVVVLDRPDPLSGDLVAGPVLDPKWTSFFGLYPIPILYGMTIGELARFFNGEFGIGANLVVVPMEGWRRSMWFDQTGLPWVMTSPGIPHFRTAELYPVTGPIGDTNLSVGVLTTEPFELVGGTFIQPWHLRGALEARRPGGVAFREDYWRGEPWTPTGGPEYAGVEIRVADRAAYRPVDLMLQILYVVHQLYPTKFRWGAAFGGQYTFDLDMGTDQVRLGLAAGRTPEQIEQQWEPGLARFLKAREPYLLYH
ncbi:MAG TPA: DUF1343 domain-containing protein [bacterium]|nr:DUF1343 domain-containing protein [bacterium]